MKNKDLGIVVILFYLGWFGSVFLAKTSFSIASLIFPVFIIAFLYFRKILTKKNIIFALAISLVGILFDFLLIRLGFITAYGDSLLLFPIWLISIWLSFSFSMLKISANFRAPLPIAALLGMIMGPLSYKSGEAFQVLSFLSPITFLIYAAFWGITFPLILFLSKRYL